VCKQTKNAMSSQPIHSNIIYLELSVLKLSVFNCIERILVSSLSEYRYNDLKFHLVISSVEAREVWPLVCDAADHFLGAVVPDRYRVNSVLGTQKLHHGLGASEHVLKVAVETVVSAKNKSVGNMLEVALETVIMLTQDSFS